MFQVLLYMERLKLGTRPFLCPHRAYLEMETKEQQAIKIDRVTSDLLKKRVGNRGWEWWGVHFGLVVQEGLSEVTFET